MNILTIRQLLRDAIDSGLARTADEALDQALDALRVRLPKTAAEAKSTARRGAAAGDLR
jgi:hypothetical protein